MEFVSQSLMTIKEPESLEIVLESRIYHTTDDGLGHSLLTIYVIFLWYV